MSGKKKPRVSEEVAPNLIPMIDIMFLLLLFFMLGADMGQRELEEVFLPKAKSIKEDQDKTGTTAKDRLTVNVYHKYKTASFICANYEKELVCRDEKHWLTGVKGHDYSEMDKLQVFLTKDSLEFRDPKNQEISERKVMIRADQSAPYGMVQKVMNTCTKVGIYKIECGAARPPDEKKHGGG